MIHQKQTERKPPPSKINPLTARMLEANPIPAPLAHLEPWALQLPPYVLTHLFIGGGLSGVDLAGLEDAVKRAVVLQDQDAWRCAACYRWQGRPADHTVLMCLVDRQIRFAILCPRCERKLKTQDRIYKAIEGYVRSEVES